MILTRRRLLARLGAAEPRLVLLCAPPGYGKTDFAELFARRFDRHATCNCAELAGTVDFAGRLMAALAGESPGGETIARTRLALHATEAGEAAWSRALLEFWKLRQERALLIIESADTIATQPGVLALIGDLLAARPAERVLLVSSRRPLPLDVARYLEPHQVLTLSRDELQLDAQEAAAIFEGTDLAEPTIDRIVRLARGWPIALLLLARIAHYEADLAGLLDRLGTIPTDLHEYLVNEVLSALTAEMTSTMLAAAAIPHATLEDISVASGIAHASPVIEGLLRLPGFITYEGGTYTLHPLLLAALRVRHGSDFADYVLRAARGNERLGDFLRAAELYNIANEGDLAAAALDRLSLETLQQPSSRLVDALAKIPVSSLATRPNLWIATLKYRQRSVDAGRLYEEAGVLQRVVSPDASPVLYRRLGIRRAMIAGDLERLAEARANLAGLATLASSGETPEEQRLALMTAAVVSAKQGRFGDADRLVEEAAGLYEARHLRFDEERAQIASAKAMTHGNWEDLLKLGEERLASALRTGPSERIAEQARTVAQAAWFNDDDDRVAAARQLIAGSGARDADAREFAAFSDLQEALTSYDGDRAVALMDRAIERIDGSENDFLRVVIRVCAALLAPPQRRRLLEARRIAASIESPPLQTSIELLVDSPELEDFGIFKGLAARVARSPVRARHDRLFVNVVRGHVRRGSEILHVSDRGLELLAALALFESGTVNEELGAALWPALDRKGAVNALKMCVSRTRAQLGDRESIQNARNGYALGEHVGSDVREIENVLHSVRGAGVLGESQRQRVERLLATWSDRTPAHVAGWSWFAPYAAYLADIRRELSQALAQDAMRRDRTAFAQTTPS